MKPKCVYIGTRQAIGRAYPAAVRQRIEEAAASVGVVDPCTWTAGDAEILQDAEYAFSTWGMPAWSESQIRSLVPKLKALFYAAGSVQTFARPFLRCGVQVFSAWGANAVPVAQVTVSEIVLANKGFFQTMHRGGAETWTERTVGAPYPGNYHTPVGVIGAGMIGSMVIKMLRRLTLDVRVYDPFLSAERAGLLGAKKVDSLPALFAECPVVSNHLADKEETRGLLDRSCFSVMRENGVFLNTGRGRQVVEADLVDALRAVPTRAAVLDVTWPEPPEAGSALYRLPNVFLTPHMAGSIGNEIGRMGETMASEFEALLSGQPTRYGVTETQLRTMA